MVSDFTQQTNVSSASLMRVTVTILISPKESHSERKYNLPTV